MAVLRHYWRAARRAGRPGTAPPLAGDQRRDRLGSDHWPLLYSAAARHIARAAPSGRDAGHIGADPTAGDLLADSWRAALPGALSITHGLRGGGVWRGLAC